MCKWYAVRGGISERGAVVGGVFEKGGGGMFFSLPICIPAFCVVSLQWQGKCGGASLF